MLMNDIYTRQNEEYFLMLQYSQRKHYEMAENVQYSIWIFMFINMIINNNSVVNNFLGTNNVKVISLVFTILYIFLRLLINRNVEIGAYTKEVIDCKLFEFDVKNRCKKFSTGQLNEFAAHKKKDAAYLCQVNNTGKDKPRGVRNWYGNRQYMDRNNAIYECQKENIWWDEKLSKIYMITFIVISIITAVVIICINRNEILTTLIFSIIIPSTQLLIEVITQCVYFVKLMIYKGKVEMKCKEIEKDLSNVNKGDLEELQELILQRRLYKFFIPNKLHSLLSKKYHEVRETLTQFD